MDVAARHLLQEAHRRFAAPEVSAMAPGARLPDLLATRFGKQHEVLACDARRVAAMCTRRAGKTELVPAKLFAHAPKYPDTVLYYVGITGKRARELMWKPLTRVNDTYGLGWKANWTLGTLYGPAGNEIRLVGADHMAELEKRRGDKASLVVVDEAQSYPDDVLHALIEDIFGPALVDVRGQIVILGTPGIVCAGMWHDITGNEDDAAVAARNKRWSVFEWSGLDNPHVSTNFRLEIEEREALTGPDDPTTLREYRGKWVNDTGALFYSFDSSRNLHDGLPGGHQWLHVMGVDLGHDDAFAVTVWAFSPTTPHLYEVESFKESGLTPHGWKEHIKARLKTHNPARVVVDTGGLGKAIVTEWQRTDGLPVEAAEKQHKAAYVKLMNGDLRAGHIKAKRNSPLAGEWSVLPKNPDDPTEEDPRFPNHCADAALYAWREALHFLGRTPEAKPHPDSPEAQRARADAWEAAAEAEARAAARERRQDMEDF